MEPIISWVVSVVAKTVWERTTSEQKCSRCNHRPAETGLNCCETPVCRTCVSGMIESSDGQEFRFKCAFCGHVAAGDNQIREHHGLSGSAELGA